jgi:archaetidylinositol phosphate synthase
MQTAIYFSNFEPIFLLIAHYRLKGETIMKKEDVKLHVREYGGLLAGPEKKTLLWLAQRTPRCINSDHLTILGFAAMIAAGACYWASRWNKMYLLFVVIALAVNWYGDSLDGTLARFRNCQRPKYGYYVDHVIDLLGTAALLGGLSLSGFMSPLIALGLLSAFALVEAEVFLATHVQQVFRLSCFCIGPTELRIVLAIGTLRLMYSPWAHIAGKGRFLLFDIGGIVSIAGLFAALLYSAVRNTRDLYRAESLAS